MIVIRRAAVTIAAFGLLAGCAGHTPVGLVPGGTQTLSLRTSPTTGRVLYVANIDGAPGLGQILVYSADMHNPQLLRTISNGAGRPFGLWVDAKNILYVANEPDKLPASVTEFAPGASSPFFKITTFKGMPESVAVDANQNVFVNEDVQNQGFVEEFPHGSKTASRVIDTGIAGYAFLPGSMAFDPQGNLIVAEQARLQLHIVKIAPNATKAVPVNVDLKNIVGPGMGIDTAGNMYVGSSEGASISVFAPGHTEPSRTINQVANYGLMSVTANGTVYEASGAYYVSEIAAGQNTPTTVFNCECSAQGVAVSR
jgi:sugar lactone lactonase YvrE